MPVAGSPGSEPSSRADPQTTVAQLGISRSLAIQFALVGTLGFVAALGLFGWVYALATGNSPTVSLVLVDAGWWNGALSALVFLVLTTAIIVPHEWLHGLAIHYYGGEPHYGVGLAHFALPYAYTTTDHSFSRDQFAVVLLAPLVGMTAVGLPVTIVLGWDWLLVPLAANAGGAVGDLWMLLVVMSYPSRVTILDQQSGFRIVGFPGDGAGDLSVTMLVWDALVGAAVASVGLFVVFGLFGPFMLSLLGIESLSIGREGTVTYLFSYVETADSISYGVGPGLLVLGALAGLGYAFVRTARRRELTAPTPSAGRERERL